MPYSKRYLAKRAFYSFQTAISTLIWPYFKVRETTFPKNQARILMYHCVSDFPHEKEIPYDSVPPDLFQTHMNILEQDCFNVISLGDLAIILKENRTIPPKTISITFDDGYKNNYLNAFPILEDMGFKATFFVIAGGMGMNKPFQHLLWDESIESHFHKVPESRLPMKWMEVRELRNRSHEIGSHGMTHRSIGNLQYKQGLEEIIRSKKAIEEAISASVTLFSYPYGAKSYNDFNKRTEPMLRDVGYTAACTGEIGSVSNGTGLYELSRIPVRETDTPFRFRQKLSGAFEWINPFKRAFQSAIPRIDKVL